MKSLLRLTDLSREDMRRIFALADGMEGREALLCGKTFALFFPDSSLRTRITFEKGIGQLGGQSILFPPETLDKKEEIRDVMGYLRNWVDGVVVRHRSLALLEEMAGQGLEVINALTSENHPCEVLSDLYALSQMRPDYLGLQYTFVGADGNIGRAWMEASRAFGLRLRQCCPPGYEIPGAETTCDIHAALRGSDVILTDALPGDALADFRPYQVTAALLAEANESALLNPCPPFFRGEEVSEDAIASPHFVGYAFKKALMPVQQAIIAYLLDIPG